MTLQQARERLEKLGFHFPEEGRGVDGSLRWGRMPAEPYDVGKDHFEPLFRDVWISKRNRHFDPKTMNCFSVSSSIKGKMRRYRCRQTGEATISNIFGIGKTLEEAVHDFVQKFHSKTYNIRP